LAGRLATTTAEQRREQQGIPRIRRQRDHRDCVPKANAAGVSLAGAGVLRQKAACRADEGNGGLS